MADKPNDQKTTGAPVADTAPPPAAAPAPLGFSVEQLVQLKQLFSSDSDAARGRETDAIRRQHAAEDAKREQFGLTRVVALTSFTVHGVDDTGLPQSRVIKAGDEFDFPRFDLPAYEGKVRLKALDADEADRRGVTITGS